jgi:MFS family permease
VGPVPRLIRDPVTWLIYTQLGIWGYVLYGFGPVVPLLRDEQQTSHAVASLHSMALAGGAILSGALFPPLVRRYGRGCVMWAGLAGVAAGVLALCAFRPVAATLSSSFALGLTGMLMLAGVVASLGEKHGAAGPAAIAEANALACALGAVAPLLVGAGVAAGLTWRPAIAVVALLIALLALTARLMGVGLPRGESAVPALGPEPRSLSERRPVSARQPLVVAPPPGKSGPMPFGYWVAWLLMCSTGSVEVCLNLWSGDVLRTHAGMGAGAAATAISGIVGGMSLGRVVGGRIALRVPAPRLLRYALALSGLGFTLFWLATAPWLAVSGLVLTGLGIAMHYPLVIGMALQASGGRPDEAAARASYAMAVAFGASPLLLGAVADQVGAHTAFLLVPVFLAGAVALVPPLARGLVEPVIVSAPA